MQEKANPLIGYGPFGSRLHMDKLQAEDGVLYYEGTTLQSCMTVGCGSQYKIEGAGEIVTVFETEEEKKDMLCVKAEWRFRKILRLPVRKLLSIHPVRGHGG